MAPRSSAPLLSRVCVPHDSPLPPQKKKIKLFTPKLYNNNNTHLSKIGASCLARAVFARSKLSCPHAPRSLSSRAQRKRCVGATPAKCGHLMATTCVTNGHGPTHHPPFLARTAPHSHPSPPPSLLPLFHLKFPLKWALFRGNFP